MVNNTLTNILITGGAGFIGYFIAKKLSDDANNQIHLFDNFSRGQQDPELRELEERANVTLIRGDLTRSDDVSQLGTDYHYVYHLAAVIGVQNVMENPDKVLYVNATSTLLLFEHLKKCTQIKRVLFSSTSEIYAGTLKHFDIPVPTPETVALTLDDIGSNRTTYMLSKMYGESIAHMYGKMHAIPYTIVRYHNVYGPRMGFKHVIPEMFIKLTSQERVEIASPEHTRAFCFVDDAVNMTIAAVESAEGANQTFHIGNSDEEIKIRDLIGTIAQTVSADVELRDGEEHPGSPARRCPDISHFLSQIGYSQFTSLEEGIKKSWDWYATRLENRHE